MRQVVPVRVPVHKPICTSTPPNLYQYKAQPRPRKGSSTHDRNKYLRERDIGGGGGGVGAWGGSFVALRTVCRCKRVAGACRGWVGGVCCCESLAGAGGRHLLATGRWPCPRALVRYTGTLECGTGHRGTNGTCRICEWRSLRKYDRLLVQQNRGYGKGTRQIWHRPEARSPLRWACDVGHTLDRREELTGTLKYGKLVVRKVEEGPQPRTPAKFGRENGGHYG